MDIEEIEALIAKHGSVTAQPLKDLIVTVVLEAVEAEREARAEWLERGVDLAGLAGAPEMQRFTAELLIGCAKAIRSRGENA